MTARPSHLEIRVASQINPAPSPVAVLSANIAVVLNTDLGTVCRIDTATMRGGVVFDVVHISDGERATVDVDTAAQHRGIASDPGCC